MVYPETPCEIVNPDDYITPMIPGFDLIMILSETNCLRKETEGQNCFR